MFSFSQTFPVKADLSQDVTSDQLVFKNSSRRFEDVRRTVDSVRCANSGCARSSPKRMTLNTENLMH